MGKLIRLKPALILLLVVELLSSSIFPQPVYAWSAVTNKSYVIRAVNWVIQSFKGESWESNQDLGSHQLMIQLAYEKLAKDPAWQDQKELFPAKDGILSWEGVVVNNWLSGIIWGGVWVDPIRGGPDAEGKTKDSLHYYNPLIPAGGAPDAVVDYYSKLLLRLYNQGNFGKSQPDDNTNHYASWSAHFLADVSVPYHTAGIPVSSLKNSLTVKESGPDYLWLPGEAKLDEKGKNIDPNSIVLPDESWGRNGDFTTDVSLFKSKFNGKDLKDWFDPWYYNGWAKAGANGLIGSGSHASWEAWAHQFIVKNKLAVVPATYSKEWKNAAPRFGVPTVNLEKQAEQARAFTADAAMQTSLNMAVYTKAPQGGFNRAVERMSTLWRASLTALRPALQVTPDPGNPKLLRVVASIRSVEPVDPAKYVQAKLTADGGKVRGKDTLPVGDVTPLTPGLLTWEVDAPDPDACKLKLEVICNYANTPDLQYAVVEPGKDRITVEVSPSNAKAGGTVTLTVKVQPAEKTDLTVIKWGPLESKPDLLPFIKKVDFTTDANGIYSGKFIVDKKANDGSYEIIVDAGKSRPPGIAKINIGLNIKAAKGIYCRIAENVKAKYLFTDKSGRSRVEQGMSISGANPQTIVTNWDGDYTVNAKMVARDKNETGNLKITFNENYTTITSFRWEANYQYPDPQYYSVKSLSLIITGGGIDKSMLNSPIISYMPDYYYKLTGEGVRSHIQVKYTQVNWDGSTQVLQDIECNKDSVCDFLVQLH
jgi:hypothetical protein